MSERGKGDEPNAWADDLAAGEAEVPERRSEVVQVNEESEMRIEGSGRVRESRQPVDPTPHSRTLAIVLAVVGMAVLLGLAYLLIASVGL